MKQLILLTFLPLFITCSSEKEINSFKDEDIKFYAQKIETGYANNEKWVETPLSIINQLLPPQYQLEGKSFYSIEISKESSDSVILIVTQEGLLDDSVYGEKRVISFVSKNNRWEIVAIKVGFKCQKSRGHQHYSGEGCS